MKNVHKVTSNTTIIFCTPLSGKIKIDMQSYIDFYIFYLQRFKYFLYVNSKLSVRCELSKNSLVKIKFT